MVVSLCSFRSRRRSGSIDVPKRWSRGGLADLGLPGQAQIFILFTHSRFASIFILFGFVTIYSVVIRRTAFPPLFRRYFPRSPWSRCANAVGTHGTNQRNVDTGSGNATQRSDWRTRGFSSSSCRSAARRPSRVLPTPTSRQYLYIGTAFHE